MGGTDLIENPGSYLHWNSKKVPYMGVLSTASLPGFQPLPPPPGPEAPAESPPGAQRVPGAPSDAPAGPPDGTEETLLTEMRRVRALPFAPVSEPLYPEGQAENEELRAKPPRWRGG